MKTFARVTETEPPIYIRIITIRQKQSCIVLFFPLYIIFTNIHSLGRLQYLRNQSQCSHFRFFEQITPARHAEILKAYENNLGSTLFLPELDLPTVSYRLSPISLTIIVFGAALVIENQCETQLNYDFFLLFIYLFFFLIFFALVLVYGDLTPLASRITSN